MGEMLTTRELQELLCVDRKTIYRMLQEGEIPAMRVGGQWRFSRQAINAWLAETGASPAQEPGPSAAGEILPLDCFTNVLQVFADAMEVGAVMTDLEGQVMIQPCNSCRFCELVFSSKQGRRRCQASWANLGRSDAPPQLERCHAGLTYARGKISVGDEAVAMVFAGNFVVRQEDLRAARKNVPSLAEACHIPEKELASALSDIPIVSAAHAEKLLKLLTKLSESLSQIGQRRLDLILRLRQVAKLANV